MLSVSNQKGLTLIEAMVTLVLLSVGMLGVAGMLTLAINGSTASYDRTSGNGVAMSVLESLKSLPFTDANLALTGAPPGVLANDANARTFAVANFPAAAGTDGFAPELRAGPAAGQVIDNSGRTFQLAWAVQDNFVGGTLANKIIRIYMTWNTPLGVNRLEMTTVKYD